MYANDISMHENENFDLEMFMGNLAVLYFMHEILIYENLAGRTFIVIHGNAVYIHRNFMPLSFLHGTFRAACRAGSV